MIVNKNLVNQSYTWTKLYATDKGNFTSDTELQKIKFYVSITDFTLRDLFRNLV